MKKRINVYITDGMDVLIREYSEKTGLSQSAIATLAVSAGLKSIQMALDPDWQAKFEDVMKNEALLTTIIKNVEQGKVKGA